MWGCIEVQNVLLTSFVVECANQGYGGDNKLCLTITILTHEGEQKMMYDFVVHLGLSEFLVVSLIPQHVSHLSNMQQART